jgi:hypothetical protein
MHCPYCGEDIDEDTSHCRLCGADLTLIQPLVAQIQLLTKRVESLEKQADFEAEIALPETAVKPIPGPSLHIPSVSDEWAVALGFIGIALAHFAVVAVFDARLSVLLGASIAIPFIAGLLRRGMRAHGALRVIASALLLSVAALTEMSLLTYSFYQVPLLPQNVHDWHEIYAYGGIIAASDAIGALIRGLIRFWFVGRGRVRPVRRRGAIARILISLGEYDAEALERTEKALRHIEYTAINLGALIGSIYFVVEHVRQILDYLPNR